jgi:hypothetical protein
MQCARQKAFKPMTNEGLLDRSRWHPVRKVHVDQCRFGVPGPYTVAVKRHVISESWCRNDWYHAVGVHPAHYARAIELRRRFTNTCAPYPT